MLAEELKDEALLYVRKVTEMIQSSLWQSFSGCSPFSFLVELNVFIIMVYLLLDNWSMKLLI